MSKTTEIEKLNPTDFIQRKHILIDEEKNSRLDKPKVEELAADIKRRGLLQPPVVVKLAEPDKKGHTHELVAGYRRLAALTTNRVEMIPVMVRDHYDPLDNLAENIHREDLHPLDLSQSVHDIVKGVKMVPDFESLDESARKKALAERLGFSDTHIINLVKIRENISEEVWKKARKEENVPLRLFIGIRTMNEKAQLKAFEKWKAQQDMLAKMGRKRKVRGSSDEGEGGEGGKGGKGGKGEKKFLTKAATTYLEDLRATASWKTNQVKGVADKARLEALIEVIDHLMGEKKRLTIITAQDTKQYKKEVEASEKEIQAEEEAAEADAAE